MNSQNADDSAAAFFDLDRTLILQNSAVLFAKYERRHGRITAVQMAQTGFWTLLYHFALLDMESVYQRAVASYAGAQTSDIEALTRTWFRSDVADLLQPGARRAIDEHTANGHPTIILTNSSCYEASIASDMWGMDGWIANTFPFDDTGALTGELDFPLCYGQGKVDRSLIWAESRSVKLEASYFYTDSLTDLPMLEAVGHPRIVNPDPRLARVARKRGWPILDWRA